MNCSSFNVSVRSAWFFLLSAIVLLLAFGGASAQPSIGDESRVAGIAMEMAQEGNYLLPRLNGSAFLEYPPFYYCCVAPWLKFFGGTPWSVHMASLLIAALMGAGLFGFARTMGLMPGAAFSAAMLLLTNNSLLDDALMCRVDILLALFALIGWWGGALCWIASRPRPRIGFWLLTAGMAGGFLTKNLAGGVVIISGLGAYLILADVLEKRFRFGRYLLFAGAFLLASLAYGLYLWCLKANFGWKAVEEMAIYNNFGRFAGSRGEHSKPVWYYLLKLPEQFQPWLILLLAAAVFGVVKMRRLSMRWLYPAVLMVAPFILLSLASGKRQVYLLPLTTPAALFTGVWLDSCMRHRGEIFKGKPVGKWLRRIWFVLLGAAAVVAVGGAVSARICGVGSLRFELGAAGVLVLGLLLFRQCRKAGTGFRSPGEQLGWTWVLAAFAIGVAVGSFQAIALKNDTYDPVFRLLEERFADRAVFLCLPPERLSGAAYYYRKKRTPVLDLKDAARQSPGTVVVTHPFWFPAFPADQWERIPVPKWTKVGIVVRRDGNAAAEKPHLAPAGSLM